MNRSQFSSREKVRSGEALAVALFSLLIIAVFQVGEENGIGYYHQPDHNLLPALIHGSIFNLGVFYLNGFILVPRFLVLGKRVRYFVFLVGLLGSAVILKTLSETFLIALFYPSLASLTLLQLALENSGGVAFAATVSLAYGLARLVFVTNRSTPETGNIQKILNFRSGGKTFRFHELDVLYIRGEGNYVRVVSEQAHPLVYASLSQLERKLSKESFLRVHRSYLVPIGKIEVFNQHSIKVGDKTIPIGKKYKNSVLARLEEGK